MCFTDFFLPSTCGVYCHCHRNHRQPGQEKNGIGLTKTCYMTCIEIPVAMKIIIDVRLESMEFLIMHVCSIYMTQISPELHSTCDLQTCCHTVTIIIY